MSRILRVQMCCHRGQPTAKRTPEICNRMKDPTTMDNWLVAVADTPYVVPGICKALLHCTCAATVTNYKTYSTRVPIVLELRKNHDTAHHHQQNTLHNHSTKVIKQAPPVLGINNCKVNGEKRKFHKNKRILFFLVLRSHLNSRQCRLLSKISDFSEFKE